MGLDFKDGERIMARFNGHWYPGLVIRITRTKVEARFWTRNGTRERVKMLPAAYVQHDVQRPAADI